MAVVVAMQDPKTVKRAIIDWREVSPDEPLDPQEVLLLAGYQPDAVQRVKLSRQRIEQARCALPWLRQSKLVAEHNAGAATPETRRKVRSDVMIGLMTGGYIQREHLMAAEEILGIYEALGRGLTPGAVDYGPRVGGGSFRDPLDRMTNAELGIWQKGYLPWIHEMLGDPITHTTATRITVYHCALGMVMAAVVDNRRVQDIEQQCGLPRKKGYGQHIIRLALDRYAYIRGLRTGGKPASGISIARAA